MISSPQAFTRVHKCSFAARTANGDDVLGGGGCHLPGELRTEDVVTEKTRKINYNTDAPMHPSVRIDFTDDPMHPTHRCNAWSLLGLLTSRHLDTMSHLSKRRDGGNCGMEE